MLTLTRYVMILRDYYFRCDNSIMMILKRP